MIEIGHASHTGLRREFNEDTYWADSELGLFLVVDGMGGPGRGEVAAAMTRDALVRAVRDGRDLADAIRAGGEAIAAFAATGPGSAPTGATLSLLRVEDGRFDIAQIGDTRLYLWHTGSLIPMRARAGAAAAADRDAPETVMRQRPNLSTQALGITPGPELAAEPTRGMLERGMQFLLCTDGLGEELDDRHIAAILARTDLAAQECVDHLLLDALDAGGRDNISVVLVRFL